MKNVIVSTIRVFLFACVSLASLESFAQSNLHREYLNVSEYLHTRKIVQNRNSLYSILSSYEHTLNMQYGSLLTQISANSNPVNVVFHAERTGNYTLKPQDMSFYRDPGTSVGVNVMCGLTFDMVMDASSSAYLMETSEDGHKVNWSKRYPEFKQFKSVVKSNRGYIACGVLGNAAAFLVTDNIGNPIRKFVSTPSSPNGNDTNLESNYSEVISLGNGKYAFVGTCEAIRNNYYMSFMLLTIYDELNNKIEYSQVISRDFNIVGDIQEVGKALAFDEEKGRLYLAGEERTGRICNYKSVPVLIQFDLSTHTLLSYDKFPAYNQNTQLVSMVNDIQLSNDGDRQSVWILGSTNHIDETGWYLGPNKSYLLELDKSNLNVNSIEMFDNEHDLILRSLVVEPNYNIKIVGNSYDVIPVEDAIDVTEYWVANYKIYEVQTRQYGHSEHCNDYYIEALKKSVAINNAENSVVDSKTTGFDIQVGAQLQAREQEFICEQGPVDDDDESNSFMHTGTSELASSMHSVSIRPNPASNMATLQFNFTKSSSVSLSLYDINGKLVEKQIPTKQSVTSGDTYSMDVSDLATGVYVLKVVAGNSVYHERLIIQK